MNRECRWLRRAFAGLLAVAAVAGVSSSAESNGAEPLPTESPCEAGWLVDYALNANLRLTGTPFGAGNGVYAIGPGTLTLWFQRGSEKPEPGAVRLVAYRMRELFTVESKVLWFQAKVRTDAVSTAERRRASGAIARGTLDRGKLTWSEPWHAVHTDGTLHCEGNACGRPGVPPEGESTLRIGPDDVSMASFVFDPSLDTFTMLFAKVSKTDMPKQISQMSLAGRRVKARCAGLKG